MTSSLVGSEMCIRDRKDTVSSELTVLEGTVSNIKEMKNMERSTIEINRICLLYTSDAADDM
eukprot:71176-Prorocentrum_lima.AAC.1